MVYRDVEIYRMFDNYAIVKQVRESIFVIVLRAIDWPEELSIYSERYLVRNHTWRVQCQTLSLKLAEDLYGPYLVYGHMIESVPRLPVGDCPLCTPYSECRTRALRDWLSLAEVLSRDFL